MHANQAARERGLASSWASSRSSQRLALPTSLLTSSASSQASSSRAAASRRFYTNCSKRFGPAGLFRGALRRGGGRLWCAAPWEARDVVCAPSAEARTACVARPFRITGQRVRKLGVASAVCARAAFLDGGRHAALSPKFWLALAFARTQSVFRALQHAGRHIHLFRVDRSVAHHCCRGALFSKGCCASAIFLFLSAAVDGVAVSSPGAAATHARKL